MNTKIVSIEWVDSMGQNGSQWAFAKELKPYRVGVVYSAGILIHENEESVTIASSLLNTGEDAQVSGLMTIPKVSIRTINGLERKDD